MRVREAARKGVRLLAARVRGRAIPFHVTLYVMKRCNLRCVYCSSPDQHTTELTADEWCAVLAELHALGTERVLFFGGEPLLRDDLAPIVSQARAFGMRTALTSNGTLVPRRPEVIRQLDTLVLSLDGPPAAHDGNRVVGESSGCHARAGGRTRLGRPRQGQRGPERQQRRDTRLAARLESARAGPAHAELDAV